MAHTRSLAASSAGLVHPQRRVRFLLLAVLFALSLFAAQLVKLQGLDASTLSEAALGSRLHTQTIPALRGQITDAGGEVLAASVERRDITADPTAVPEYRRTVDGAVVTVGVEGAARDIARLTGADAEELAATLRGATGRFTYLVKDVSVQTWREVQELGIPGIYAEPTTRRTYPLGQSHASLVGWVGADGTPAAGIEQMMDEQLTGTPGESVYERGGNGEMIATGQQTTQPAVPGQDVQLTIDSDIQWYAQNALAQRVIETESLSGYAVVMEARTGRLVAVASYPSFDPASPTQTGDGLRSQAFVDVYEPGSTSKVITAAAALEEGVVEADTPVVVPENMTRGGRPFRDSQRHPTLYLTFAGVLAQSSNMGTILVGEQLDNQTLHDYNRRFGMGQKSPIGFPGESAGILADPQDWSASQRYTMMFGQGLSSNAIQQAGVFQTIANDGVRIPASLVAGTTDVEGTYHEAQSPEGTRVVSAETAREVGLMLEQVVSEDGTAPWAMVDGYRVAGKTSTASRYDPEQGGYSGYTASFVGFAPVEDPEYVVAVTLQRPTVGGIYGGPQAGPVFSDVLRYTLQKRGVAPSSEPAPKMELTFDETAPAPGQGGATMEDIALRDKDERDD